MNLPSPPIRDERHCRPNKRKGRRAARLREDGITARVSYRFNFLTKRGLEPITFHGLRHTYASRLAMKGVPLAVIAAQLGHSDIRMVEKHYGHLAPNYVADRVRAAFGSLGIVDAMPGG
jgi:integrase